MKKKAAVFWIITFLSIILFFQFFSNESEKQFKEVGYSEFMNQIKADNIQSIFIKGRYSMVENKAGNRFKVFTPYPEKVLEKLEDKNVNIRLLPTENDFSSRLPLYMPLIIFLMIIGLLYGLARTVHSSGSRALGLGKTKAKLQSEKTVKVRFKDVAGIDEATEELQSIVDFLKNPKKFEKLGGKIPKGVLLYGPPGNGKTLLARAIAGEAGVMFYTVSGSDFVEMVVGVGAARVRDLFEQAKKHAPCIIFIDELDAVGRKRNAGFVSGGHEEREQTLNQLLVEMDGFEGNKGIIIIAATNRVDVLDSALLRPGRFDRHIPVTPPDIQGRKKILEVHSKKVPLAKDVDFHVIARGTPGFSGADLANLVNEAALDAAKKNRISVSMDDFEHAKDKIIMGTAHQSRILTDEDRATIAHHEAGHAVLAYYTRGAHPIHKATIISRGQALGMVVQLPEKDQVLMSKEQALASIMVSMGGRIAEKMFFGSDKVTSGASNDIEQATNIATRMVMEWGLIDHKDDEVPFRSYKNDRQDYYAQSTTFSDEIMRKNDARIEQILKNCFEKASELLLKYKQEVEKLAKALLEYETLNLDEITNLFEYDLLPIRVKEEIVISEEKPKKKVTKRKK